MSTATLAATTAAAAASIPRVYWLTEEFPPEVGGTGLVAASLSAGLAERNVDVHVITRQTQPASAERERIGRVAVRRIQPAGRMKGVGWRALPAMIGYLARLATLLIREAKNYDMVVVSCMKIIPLAAVPVCRMLGKPCLIRLESPFEIVEPIASESLAEMHGVVGRSLARALRAAQRSVLKRADCVIAISLEIERLLLSAPEPPARIVKIPNTVDLSKFHPIAAGNKRELRRQLGIPEHRTVALFTGRLSRAKGIGMLVESWPQLLRSHPDLLLLVVGSGKGSWDDCESQIAEFVSSHHLHDHIVLVGQSDVVTQYMQAADFFIFPSEYEGFSLAVTEALGSGLPSVLTSVGVATELLVDGVSAFLFPPKDREAMIRAIEVCLDRRADWGEIGPRAREAVAHCDKPRVFDQYATLCRELCSPMQRSGLEGKTLSGASRPPI
jgi:glycosyltransferase involved in cell wall biosynthesis